MTRPPLIAALALAAMAASGAAYAQYKVVGPDGKITYTDRPPVAADNKVTPMRSTGAPAADSSAALASLPLELRQVAQRFPVVLYTTADCPPCEAARRVLRQRGIPFSERIVTSNDDLQALEQRTSDRALPAMTVGSHATSGWAEGQWTQLLDLAGYPAQSRLPAAYKAPAPAPLVPPKPVDAAPAARGRAPSDAPPAQPDEPPPPSGIRF
ncbi:MAG: glutaredoxin family protein [Aquabacterium sp.]|nr:glutaredoxin family protein [Aquabacterium sp.]